VTAHLREPAARRGQRHEQQRRRCSAVPEARSRPPAGSALPSRPFDYDSRLVNAAPSTPETEPHAGAFVRRYVWLVPLVVAMVEVLGSATVHSRIPEDGELRQAAEFVFGEHLDPHGGHRGEVIIEGERRGWGSVDAVTGAQVVFRCPGAGAAAHHDAGEGDIQGAARGGLDARPGDHGRRWQDQFVGIFHVKARIKQQDILRTGAYIDSKDFHRAAIIPDQDIYPCIRGRTYLLGRKLIWYTTFGLPARSKPTLPR